MDEMEEWLQQEEVMGMVQHGKQGLAWMKHDLWGEACVKERRKMVGEGVEKKGGREEICEGSWTGTAWCLELMGRCAGEDVEMARDLEDGANTVEFPVLGNV